MTNNKRNTTTSTSASPAPENRYVADPLRFEKSLPVASTTQIVSPSGYKVFISASGEVVGAYSTTSRQESYRALNAISVANSTRR